jgi:peptidoglycan-N-acetylglucosamine deacetylase
VVSLTYDDGPDPVWTPAILDVLARHAATATFFVLGPLAERHPGLIERMAREGHEIALHADDHVRHTELDGVQIAADAAAGLARLYHLGARPERWRTPWGVETQDTKVVADRLGLELVRWTVDTHDWRGDPASAMLAACAGGIRDGAVVLMHDGLGPGACRDGCASTVELTALLLDLAAQHGLEAVSLAMRRAVTA